MKTGFSTGSASDLCTQHQFLTGPSVGVAKLWRLQSPLLDLVDQRAQAQPVYRWTRTGTVRQTCLHHAFVFAVRTHLLRTKFESLCQTGCKDLQRHAKTIFHREEFGMLGMLGTSSCLLHFGTLEDAGGSKFLAGDLHQKSFHLGATGVTASQLVAFDQASVVKAKSKAAARTSEALHQTSGLHPPPPARDTSHPKAVDPRH